MFLKLNQPSVKSETRRIKKKTAEAVKTSAVLSFKLRIPRGKPEIHLGHAAGDGGR